MISSSSLPNLSQSLILLLCLSVPSCFAAKHTLCADPVSGGFVGLAADADTYDSIPGSMSPGDQIEQKWILVEEQEPSADKNNTGPIHSFTGKFLQVLPDTGRTYPGRGERLSSVETLLQSSPYIQYQIHVEKEGWHTLFLRWTGGDEIGGGDSLYVAMLEGNSAKVDTKAVSGQRSLKPLMVPIDASATSFAGCCYNGQTHACRCVKTAPDENDPHCPFFVAQHEAAGYGIQCPLGPGAMEFIKDPKWYLFAGQSVGNVEDFAAEPWDATCEANGSNTADSGADVASWYLSKGTYSLAIFAREDGTAFDGFYIAGPDSDAPLIQTIFSEGESTTCEPGKDGRSRKGSSWFKKSTLAISVVGMISMIVFAVTRHPTFVRGLFSRSVPSSTSNRDGLYHQMEQFPESDVEG